MIPLFDLDSTLLKGGNTAHADAFAWAFHTIYGVEASLGEIMPEGMTDNEILTEILKLHGLTDHDITPRLSEATKAMEKYFLEHENEAVYVPLPGAVEILTELRQRGVPAGLLTGNVEGIAWRKCEKAGIRHLLDFGAFGDEALRRPDLVPIAKSRAPKSASAADTFVIVGDSPRDMLCAKEADISSIGVASGKHSVADLQEAGAGATVETLEDTSRVLALLGLQS